LLYYPNNERDIKEIKIYYDFNKPFLVKAIAMLTENNGSVLKYDVYEYEYYAETDVEVKNHIKKLVEPPCGENTCTIK